MTTSYAVLTDADARRIADFLRFPRTGRLEITDHRSTVIVSRERSNSAPVIEVVAHDA